MYAFSLFTIDVCTIACSPPICLICYTRDLKIGAAKFAPAFCWAHMNLGHIERIRAHGRGFYTPRY